MDEARELERKNLHAEEAQHRLDIAASKATLQRITAERAYYDALDKEEKAIKAYNSFISQPLNEQEAVAEAEQIFKEASVASSASIVEENNDDEDEDDQDDSRLFISQAKLCGMFHEDCDIDNCPVHDLEWGGNCDEGGVDAQN